MRTKLTCLFVIIGFITNAQFRIQPQVGLENSKTTVQFNDLRSFAPLGIQFAPRVAIRMDYKFKKGHGPFVGVATSSPVIAYNFTDPQTGGTQYIAKKQELQVRFEGGYQVSTKPIYFAKHTSAPMNHKTYSSSSGHKCGSGERTMLSNNMGYMHHCERSCTRTNTERSDLRTSQNKGWFMRIVPEAGVALIPKINNDIKVTGDASQTNYQYKAGAWNTAFIGGAGFEIGDHRSSKFILNVNYLKGLGNLDTRTMNHVVNGKTTSTTLKSSASSWNVSLGIPLTFTKQKTIVTKHCTGAKTTFQGKCGQHYGIYQQ